MPTYQYPLLFAFLLLGVGIASRLQTHYGWVVTWEEDADPYEWAREGKIHKLKRYTGVLALTSWWIGRIAGWLERSAALLNFTDFHLSLITHASIFIITSLLSCILYMIALNRLIFIIGFIIFIHKLPQVIKSYLEQRKMTQLAAQGVISPATTTTPSPPPTTTTPSEAPTVDQDALDAAILKQYPTPITRIKIAIRRIIRHHIKPTMHFLIHGIKHLLARAPDGHEIGHRVIARRALVKERVPPQIYGPNGPDVPPTPSPKKIPITSPSDVELSSPDSRSLLSADRDDDGDVQDFE